MLCWCHIPVTPQLQVDIGSRNYRKGIFNEDTDVEQMQFVLWSELRCLHVSCHAVLWWLAGWKHGVHRVYLLLCRLCVSSRLFRSGWRAEPSFHQGPGSIQRALRTRWFPALARRVCSGFVFGSCIMKPSACAWSLPEAPSGMWRGQRMAGDHQHDAEKEKAALKAGRVDTQHSGCLCSSQQQEQTHTGHLCLLQMHLAQNNNECDSQLRERPNSGRRARKLQATWDKTPTGQLQLISAELLSETKITALFAESLLP